MNFRKIKGYVLLGVGGLVLVAAAVLVLLQWGNTAELSVFGKNTQANTLLLMLCSAAGGLVVVAAAWLVLYAVKALRAARQADLINLGKQALKDSKSPADDQGPETGDLGDPVSFPDDP